MEGRMVRSLIPIDYEVEKGIEEHRKQGTIRKGRIFPPPFPYQRGKQARKRSGWSFRQTGRRLGSRSNLLGNEARRIWI